MSSSATVELPRQRMAGITGGLYLSFAVAMILADLLGHIGIVWFLQANVLPDNPAISYAGLAPSFVAEVGLGLWLLVEGVNVMAHARGR